ncbi:hypothetical protein G7068_16150 [Leucobacter viscericola]|uniref:Uncharacterized protein n=1 Tax=Leucobacter viscericola TaxID=2714935 RepID=A0A6G7XJH1_9MICO|nr:hypothetical protein [Leucobacter viscericola]QIK61797.1 hypothetical protein G7068_00160 [Leucobacter viscericola]QIK64579.1 hypothetical protein G7068_16150 [Leucobacter viscericola]
MEQERCGQCGMPVWMCHDETGGVQFSIQEDECVAKREIDRRNDADSKKGKSAHGISLRPEPYYVDGATWLETRDTYYKTLVERASEAQEGIAA